MAANKSKYKVHNNIRMMTGTMTKAAPSPLSASAILDPIVLSTAEMDEKVK